MKKILLILLAFTSFASFAQAEFPEGIALSGNASSANTSKVVVQEPATGNLNYINALDLPASTADKLKGFLSTGLIKNGLISANGDPTKFNITAGVGIISNFDDPENPVSTIINFPAFNSITPTYLATGNITYVAINSTPAVVMQATPFTPEQRRSLIVLGAAIHSNLTTINVLNNISAPTNADTNQLHDFMEAVGALNITGNKYTANGANLQLNKSAGVLFKLGSNFAVDWKNPHEIAQSGGTSITFRYRTQNGTESADMTSISPGLYDLNNVLTTVPNNKFTIQTVTVFQTGLTRIQWGQTIYDDLQSAKNALLTRDFIVENNIKENGVTRAYIIVRNSTTSLQNVSDAYISETQKFGGVASGGVALTLSSIVTALGYTPENEANKQNSLAVDGTGIKYPTVDAINTGLATKQNTLTNPITGTGTTNNVPKWTGTTTQGNSNFSDNGTTTASSTDMTINGQKVGRGPGNNVNNTVLGFEAFNANISGNQDLALGWRSLFSSTTSNSNTAVGVESMYKLTSLSNNNSSIGASSLYNMTSGNWIVANGTQVLFGLVSGGRISAIGAQAGRFIADKTTAATTIDDGVLIGYRASPLTNGSVNEIVIGYDGIGLGSNSTAIGNSSTLRSRIWGRFLSGTSVDDGVNQGQFNGTISFSAGTLANQGVIKSQLDLKANIDSPTFTGVPSVPTATTGTNTTQIASTAFVQSAINTSSNWTITGDDIQNNNIGNVKITNKLLVGGATTSSFPFPFSVGVIGKTASSEGFRGGILADLNEYKMISGSSGNTYLSSYAGVGITLVSEGNINDTGTGNAYSLSIPVSFSPTSGTRNYSSLNINPAINQTGGSNGITRGLYINPTLTSVVDYRAIEVVTGKVIVPNITTTATPEYADNAAAITAGLSVGTHYRTGDLLKIVH